MSKGSWKRPRDNRYCTAEQEKRNWKRAFRHTVRRKHGQESETEKGHGRTAAR